MENRRILEHQENLFSSIVETTPDAIISIDSKGKIIFWNRAAESMFGYSAKEMIDQDLKQLMPQRYWKSHNEAVPNLMRTGQPKHIGTTRELVGLRRDRSEFPMELALSSWKGEGQMRFTGIIRDITERKQAEQALQRSEALYRDLVETSQDLIFRCDGEGRFTYLNPAWEGSHGYPLDEMINHSIKEFAAPDIVNRDLQQFERLTKGDSMVGFETTHISKSGAEIHLVFQAKPIWDAAGKIIGIQGTAQNVTEQRGLERKITEIQEEERNRIGQELHDGLGQYLVGIKYLCAGLGSDLAKRGAKEIPDLAKICAQLDEAIRRTGTLAKTLYPVVVHADGFMMALEQYATEVCDLYGIECRLEYDHPIIVENYSVATQLYHIVQEATINAIRHGSADSVLIQLATEADQITLYVRDNGTGLGKGLPPKEGVGIHSMRSRARAIGVSFDIQSLETGGTIVKCSWREHQFH